MSRFIKICFFVVAALLLGCNDSDETGTVRRIYEFAFQIVDENGHDYFHNYEGYEISETELRAQVQGGNQIFGWGRVGTAFDSLNIISTTSYDTHENLRFIDYGNGDADTLYFEKELDDDDQLAWVTYCFNNGPCHTLDFENNPDLFDRYELSASSLLAEQLTPDEVPILKLIKSD